jgi:ABC-type antimicrobial peptide transport system permease subunit
MATLALTLAAAGLFGVTLNAVGRRLREFGVRVAVGATPRSLALLALRDALRMALFGMAAGAALGYACVRLLRTFLYGVKPESLPAFLAAVAAVILMTILAALFPAWRAARTNPIEALRVE